MALVHGPLFSLEAHGSINQSLTYRRSARNFVCRKWAKPGGVPSVDQLTIRLITGFLMKRWHTLTTEQKNSWSHLATLSNVQAIMVFVRENYRLNRLGLPMTDTYPSLFRRGLATFHQSLFHESVFSPVSGELFS